MIKIVKVNNPNWVANLGPLVQDFCEKIDMPNINFYSVIAYFQRTAQIGGELAELWTAFEDDIPIGFAHWCVRGIPLVGTVYLDYLYSKANKREVVKKFIEQFLRYGAKHNSPWYMLDIMKNPKLLKYLRRFAGIYDAKLIEQPYVPFLARLKNEGNNKSNH